MRPLRTTPLKRFLSDEIRQQSRHAAIELRRRGILDLAGEAADPAPEVLGEKPPLQRSRACRSCLVAAFHSLSFSLRKVAHEGQFDADVVGQFPAC